jgi:hypothetical protein
MRFSPGDPVCWRSVHDGIVRTARPMVAVRDDADLVALYLPTGTVYARRTGTRGGPGGRMMIEWDGGYAERTWGRNRVLVLHRPGRAHTVQLFWDESDRLIAWYVNPEAPWRRSSIGFDTYEHILDVVISPDRSTSELKDEDELEWKVAQGEFTAAEALDIRAEATRAASEVLAGEPPWTSEWEAWRPDARWSIPSLSPGWSDART